MKERQGKVQLIDGTRFFGNPPVEGNWKTHYLWDEVLQADSLLDILQRFMHLEVTERQIETPIPPSPARL